MCAQYLESFVDSIIVRDDAFKPVGTIGGYELLDNFRRNPTRDYQYSTKVGEVMNKNITEVGSKTTLADLVEIWRSSGRAFSIILNEYGDCSTISARRMIEVGTRCRSDLSVSSLHRSKAVTFSKDASLGELLELMYEKRVRKLLLENSEQYISDRLILSEVSKILRFQPDVESFSDLPVSNFKVADAVTVQEDMSFDQLCSMMLTMDHPLVLYEGQVITPWDVCLGLLSEQVMLLEHESVT